MKERLQKVIAKAGLASRREAEKFIRGGMVKVDGVVATELGTKVDPTLNKIEVNGKLITDLEPKAYIMLNKPKGYITTLKDTHKRPTVADLIKDIKTRVFPVGRLDYDTEGLLLFTNDGDLAQRLLHPSNKVLKTYLTEIDGTLNDRDISKFESGIELSDGITSWAKLKFVRTIKGKSRWEVSIYEGKKRQIKRMFESLGHSVYGLKRTRFGSLKLEKLGPGKYRFLRDQEIRDLKQLTGPEHSDFDFRSKVSS
ncbi:MAG: pseudouridine synthase [Pseudomonadota bacterium]